METQPPIRTNYDAPGAAENANPDNWHWGSKHEWKEAPEWNIFIKYWRAAEPEAFSPRFLSLDPLPLSLPGKLSSIFFVRDAYKTMFDHVWTTGMTLRSRNGVIITGQPGIGKTVFLFYLLIRLLQKKQLVLFSIGTKISHLFYHDGVYTIKKLSLSTLLPQPKVSSGVFIWSLFDMGKSTGPPDSLVERPCFPVQTTSPDPIRYKLWYKNHKPWFTGLPLWTSDELEQALPHQEWYPELYQAICEHYKGRSNSDVQKAGILGALALITEHDNKEPRDLAFRAKEDAAEIASKAKEGTAELASNAEERTAVQVQTVTAEEKALQYLLKLAIERFGYSARDVFDAVENFTKTTSDHKGALGAPKFTFKKLVDAVAALPTRQGADTGISNAILTISPIYDESVHFQDVSWKVNFKSHWIATITIDELARVQDFEARKLITTLRGIREASSMVGFAFEQHVHRVISDPSPGRRKRKLNERITGSGDWSLITMIPNKANPPKFTTTGQTTNTLAKIKREVIVYQSIDTLDKPLKHDGYYRPISSNFPLFDSFITQIPSQSQATLWLLQATVSSSHRGSADGYVQVRKIISSLKKQLKEGKPQGTQVSVEVRYLLVVPEDDCETWAWQFPTGWNEKCHVNDHRGDVYCLKISDAF